MGVMIFTEITLKQIRMLPGNDEGKGMLFAQTYFVTIV